MTTKAADGKTLAFYEKNAWNYSTRKPRNEDLEALEYFMNEIPSGTNICDLGCGNGWASAKLVENGYTVRAIDGSASMADEAMRMYSLPVEVATFDQFSFKSYFDGLWACWSLHHTPSLLFPQILAQVSQGICPGGFFFFSIKGGTRESRDENDRLYSYYDWDELYEIVRAAVDGEIVNRKSWRVKDSDEEGSMRHQVFIRMASG